jgi:hypothetical protein
MVRQYRQCVAIGLIILLAASVSGISNAQSAEEGTANFYSDSFQRKKMASLHRYRTKEPSVFC